MKAITDWFMAHKAPFSYALGVIAAGLEAKGQTQAALIVGFVAAWLNGGGHLKSDSYYKQP